MNKKLHLQGGKYIDDFIIGFNDGIVSIFALVAGVSGALVSNRIILLSGFAGLTAGAVSMGLNNYISEKSEKEFIQSLQEEEKRSIKKKPKEEEQEIKDIFKKKGFKGKILEKIVDTITASKKIWVRTMMLEEHRVPPKEESKNPFFSAFLSGFSFIVGAIIPIIPYFFMPVHTSLMISALLSLSILFTIGAAKTVITRKNWFYSGLEMTFIGASAALLAYFVGELFR